MRMVRIGAAARSWELPEFGEDVLEEQGTPTEFAWPPPPLSPSSPLLSADSPAPISPESVRNVYDGRQPCAFYCKRGRCWKGTHCRFSHICTQRPFQSPKQHPGRVQYPMAASSSKDSAAPEKLPSVGSAGHAQGTCKPCAHSWRAKGCNKERACTFCHLCGEEAYRTQRRLKTAQRPVRTTRKHRSSAGGERSRDQAQVDSVSDSTSGSVSSWVVGSRSCAWDLAQGDLGILQVKNTFIHVQPVGQRSQRSRSTPPLAFGFPEQMDQGTHSVQAHERAST